MKYYNLFKSTLMKWLSNPITVVVIGYRLYLPIPSLKLVGSRGLHCFKKWANPDLFFVFCPFLITISIILIEESIDGVLRIRIQGHRMVGADKTTLPTFLTLIWLIEKG